MAQLKYWVWLSSKPIWATRREAALNHFGTIDNLYYAEPEEYAQVEGLTKQDIMELSDKSFDTAERILEKCDMENIKIVTMQDARFPDRLKNIYAPPIMLYYKGSLPVFDEEAAVGVIGTRNPSLYGARVAERIAFDMARMGGYIVSGMAAGLDTSAHIGALKAGRPTAAVLGGGADVIYPAENREVYEDIVSAGVIISEYPPGTRPIAGHFPERNRIISGLSLGVLVVEAGLQSGTLITARHASEQGRDLFAIPGPIDAEKSVGTNGLIRDGYAKLTTGAWDVLVEYAALYPHKINENIPTNFKFPENAKKSVENAAEKVSKAVNIEVVAIREIDDNALKGMNDEQRSIIEAILDGPLYIDDIADSTGITAARVMGELTLLEIEGYVQELAGKRYVTGEKLYRANEG